MFSLRNSSHKVLNFFCKSAGYEGKANVYYIGREGSNILDEAEIKAIQSGGPEQYRPFVQSYGPYIYRTVYAVLRSPQDAEDVTQEALMQIYRSLPNCRLDGFKTWITRIAVNKAIDFKRSKARRVEELLNEHTLLHEHPAMVGDEVLIATPSPAAESVAMAEADKQQVREQIAKLPEKYREIVTAYYMDEKSYEQIALETGLQRKSVESRLYRARGWMKRHWRKEDFE